MKELVNNFLVSVFKDILKMEERALTGGKHAGLSIVEMHIIEEVCRLKSLDDPILRSMSSVAENLKVTKGSLTVAVKTLERKGYLIRRRYESDGRVFLLEPTDSALSANCRHRRFHAGMVDAVVSAVSKEQLPVLCDALAAIDKYFKQYMTPGNTLFPAEI